MSQPYVRGARIPLPTLTLVLALATLSIAAATWGSGSAQAAEAPPCTPQLTKSHGKETVINCGPATVTLQVEGHTYHYRHGFCQDSKSAGAKLSLDMGTLVAGTHGNAGEPYFSMLIANADIDGSVFEADFGGKQVLGDNLISYSNGVMTGTFKGEHTEVAFSGSWNCHGVLWHAP
ncbi:MAG TPA: hypothetical protein VGC32_02515 [Solirubrobacterales bacterium]